MSRRNGKPQVPVATATPPPVPPGSAKLDFKPEDEPEGDAWGDDGLTHRQRLFVKAYVGPAAGNATRAAKMAGYSDSNRHVLENTASRLLSFVGVQRAVARAMAEKTGGPEWTRAGIREIANANMAAFYKRDEKGNRYLDLEAAYEAGAMGQIKEIQEEVICGGDGPAKVIRRKVKLYDRLKALEIEARIQGQLIDRTEDVTPRPSVVGKLLTNPAAFRAARALAGALNDADAGPEPERN